MVRAIVLGTLPLLSNNWCPVGGVIPWVHMRESAGVYVPSGRGYTMGAHEGECWGVCAQWEGLYHGWRVLSGRGYTMGARGRVLGCTCPVVGVIPWVHVRESAGMYVPSGRGHTMGAHEGECWGVCAQWEELYHGCT